MELKEFVKKVVIDLNGALDEIRDEIDYTYTYQGESGKDINFDIKVELIEEKGTEGNIDTKMKVFGIGLGAEASGNSLNSLNNSHRIQFSIHEQGHSAYRDGRFTKHKKRYEK